MDKFLADKHSELVANLEDFRLIEVALRRGEHGPRERDGVVRPPGVLLHRLAVVFHRGVPVAGASRLFTFTERSARPAAGRDDGQQQDGDRSCTTCV